MGFKTFANNEVLTAADVNALLMRQAVIVVANATAENAIPVPHEGMLAWREDLDVYRVYRAGAWSTLREYVVPAYCSLRKSANQNLTNAAAAVSWDVEVADALGMHDNVTNNSRIYARRAGTYMVNAYVYNSNLSGMGTVQARLNGTTDIPGTIQRRDAGSGALPLLTTFPVALALNDYIEIMVLHATSAGNIAGGTTLGGATLTMQWIGE